MTTTPRTNAIHKHLRKRTDFTKTDAQVWREFAETLELEIQKLRVAGSNLHGDLCDARHKLSRAKVYSFVGERSLADWVELTRNTL